MGNTISELTTKDEFTTTTVELFNKYFTTRLEAFEAQATKLQTIEG
jgi:hypothetical protein